MSSSAMIDSMDWPMTSSRLRPTISRNARLADHEMPTALIVSTPSGSSSTEISLPGSNFARLSTLMGFFEDKQIGATVGGDTELRHAAQVAVSDAHARCTITHLDLRTIA